MKKYIIKPTKKQLDIMKLYWEMFQKEECMFLAKVNNLEKKMSKETGINGLEFINCDGDWCGIGNTDRTLALLQREELVKNE